MESNRNTSIQVFGGEAYKGPQGIQGPMGPQGPQGEQGPVGPRGADGVNGKDGRDGIDGKDGQDGKGIKSITLINTKDKVKTYRIEYTDGTSFDFQVKDGEDGSAGKGGMSGGAVLRGAEKTSRKTSSYNTQSIETYPNSKALYDAIHSIKTIKFLVVDELPTVGQSNIVYLIQEVVQNTRSSSGSNIYSEWVFVYNESEQSYSWEKLGTDVDLSDYEHKTAIEELDATDSITLGDNTVYNGGEQTSLTIDLPAASAANFICEIVFTSGDTATTLSYPNTIKWLGDDVAGNVFTPVTSKRYTIIIYYDGVEYVAVVKGVV